MEKLSDIFSMKRRYSEQVIVVNWRGFFFFLQVSEIPSLSRFIAHLCSKIFKVRYCIALLLLLLLLFLVNFRNPIICQSRKNLMHLTLFILVMSVLLPDLCLCLYKYIMGTYNEIFSWRIPSIIVLSKSLSSITKKCRPGEKYTTLTFHKL